MKLWIIVVGACATGVLVGAVRAWYDAGSFDPRSPLAALTFPKSDEPDYWQPPEGRQPKATFENTTFAFGKLEIGHTMKHAFVVRNEGDFPLVLAARDSSCVCTLAEITDRPLLPGESGEVTLKWSVPKEARPGERYRQWASVDTNDPRQANVTLVVEGELSTAAAAEVAEVDFGRMAASQTKNVSVRVHGFRATESGNPVPLLIEGYDAGVPDTARWFDVKPEPLAPQELGMPGATSGCRVTLTVKPGLPWGPFRQTIRLRTSYADVPPVVLPVVGEIGADLYVAGPGYSERTGILVLPTARIANDSNAGSDSVVERRLRLIAFGSAATATPTIRSVSPASLEASLGEASTDNDGGKRWPLVVKVRAKKEKVHLRGPERDRLGHIEIDTGIGAPRRVDVGVSLAVE